MGTFLTVAIIIFAIAFAIKAAGQAVAGQGRKIKDKEGATTQDKVLGTAMTLTGNAAVGMVNMAATKRPVDDDYEKRKREQRYRSDSFMDLGMDDDL